MPIQNRDSQDFQEALKHFVKEQHDLYQETVEYAEDVAVHAYGKKPEKILDRSRPRETPEVKEYRLQIYEPKTKAKFNKALGILQKMFNDKLFSIKWSKPASTKIKEDETLQNYCTEDYPIHNSIINYFKSEGLKKVLSNPMGLFTVTLDSEVNENEFNKPVVDFYTEDQIIGYKENVYYVIHVDGELDKNSILWVYDDIGIYVYKEIKQNGNTKPHRFELIEEYIHNFREIPLWRARGIFEYGVYKSFFDAAFPYWNKAINHDSDLDGVLVNQAYPHMYAVEVDCDNQECQNGKINVQDRVYDCQRCLGTGKVTTNRGTYGYFSINEDKLADNPAIVPPLGFVSPDSAIIEYLDNKIERLMDQGLDALNMLTVIGENQSGRAKEWDRAELHESIKDIADIMFNVHLVNAIHFINLFRYEVIVSDKTKLIAQEPEIGAPSSFDILTVSDVSEEIAKITELNVNSHYTNAVMKDLVNKRFSANPDIRKELIAFIELDPFSNISKEDKEIMLINKTTTKEEVILSDNIKLFVEEAVDEDSEFYSKPEKEQKEILRAKAKEFISSQELQTNVNPINDTGGANGVNQ